MPSARRCRHRARDGRVRTQDPAIVALPAVIVSRVAATRHWRRRYLDACTNHEESVASCM